MKVPVVIQHGERKCAASLIVVVGRERIELMPTQQHVLEIPEGTGVLVEFSMQGWETAQAPETLPALVHAPRDRRLSLNVEGVSQAIEPGQAARFEIRAGDRVVLDLSPDLAPARPAAAAPAARRRSGRAQVKPRSGRGGKARKARRKASR